MSAKLCSCVCLLLLTCADGACSYLTCARTNDETSLLQVARHVEGLSHHKDQVRHADVVDTEKTSVEDEADLDKQAEAMHDWFANVVKKAYKGENWKGGIGGGLAGALIVWPLGTAIRKNIWNYGDALSQHQIFALPTLISVIAVHSRIYLENGTFAYMTWYLAVLIATVAGCVAQLINYKFPYPGGGLFECPWEKWARENYELSLMLQGRSVPYEVQADEAQADDK